MTAGGCTRSKALGRVGVGLGLGMVRFRVGVRVGVMVRVTAGGSTCGCKALGRVVVWVRLGLGLD